MGHAIERIVKRYSRQVTLKSIGLKGQEALMRSTALVAGVGGLGSAVAEILARMGIGKLVLVDRDYVSLSDIHRQILYSEQDVYEPKVEAARRRIREINSEVEVETRPISAMNLKLMEPLVREADVVIDGLDNMRARYALNYLAVRGKKPYVFAAAASEYGNVSTIVPGLTPCLEEFYGGLEEAETRGCEAEGINPAALLSVASVEASEAVKILTGNRPSLASRLMLIDISSLSFETVELKKNDSCPICSLGEERDYPEVEVEVGCARGNSVTVYVNRPSGVDVLLAAHRLLKEGFGAEIGRYYIRFRGNGVVGILYDTGYMAAEAPADGDPGSLVKSIYELAAGR